MKTSTTRWMVAIAFAIAGMAGCAGDLEDVERFLASEVNLEECADTVPAAFSDPERCGACHTPGNDLGGGLDLSSPDVGSELAGVNGQCPEEPILDPANPQASTLVRWLAGEFNGCDTDYSRMPPIGAGLTGAETQCLLVWIDNLDGVEDLTATGGGQ